MIGLCTLVISRDDEVRPPRSAKQHAHGRRTSIFPACSRFPWTSNRFDILLERGIPPPYRLAYQSQKHRTKRRRQFALAQWPNQNANTQHAVSYCILNRIDSRFASSSTFSHRRLAFTLKSRAFSSTRCCKVYKCTGSPGTRGLSTFFFSFFFYGIGL